ncbi:MAG: DUF3179 domain-containing protein [Halocynthiibacter sp.]
MLRHWMRMIGVVGIMGLGMPALASPEFWRQEWPNTDFSNTSIENWVEILSGGPPKDGIRSIEDPSFTSVDAKHDIPDREPVIALEIEGAPARAYPIRYLIWHEIVNDTIGTLPVSVTFCPLCNSAIVFDRRLGGETYEFGVSGKLRNSDMIMYDRQTESWWQQALGQGIVGVNTGKTLTQIPSWMESFATFKSRNPNGLVMDKPTRGAPYGRNPYANYDSSYRPFLFSGELPPHDIPATARVIRVGEAAWPMDRLRKEGAITENGVTLSWVDEQASALDHGQIAKGKSVGAIRVRDAKGRDVAHDVMFAFAFHAFYPNGAWMVTAP